MDWSPPERLDEYQILRPLGQGAMGRVYLAHDTLLHRQVAVKFLSAAAPAPALTERFLVEARAIARLSHPNVVAIYRVGHFAGRPYLVSEYIAGQGLDRIARPLPWRRALDIGLGLARGLGAAHRGGIVHRDVKPANVILGEEGAVKLLDFGLAKLQPEVPGVAAGVPGPPPVPALPEKAPDGDPRHDVTLSLPGAARRPAAGPPPESPEPPALTAPGGLIGTPLYMAPEVWGRTPATPRADVYSLGALLYELCTGETPHRGADLQVLGAMVTGQDARPLAERLPGVDPRFAAVVDRCLRRDPAARFGDGDELAGALARVGRPGSRRAWLLGVAGGGGLLGLVALLLPRAGGPPGPEVAVPGAVGPAQGSGADLRSSSAAAPPAPEAPPADLRPRPMPPSPLPRVLRRPARVADPPAPATPPGRPKLENEDVPILR